MAENTPQTPEAVAPAEPQPEVQPTRMQSFVNKHPRAARVTAIVGAIGTVAGAVCFTRTVQSNKQHAEAAGEHAKEALRDLAATADPATSDTEA